MANRNTTPRETKLIKSKEEFKLKIKERIKIGNELISRSVNSENEFSLLKKDYSNWNDYNSEYLKQSFNVEYNEYKKSYDDSGAYIGLIRKNSNLPSPYNKYKEYIERIEAKILNLERLHDKTDLLKSDIDNKNFIVPQVITIEKDKVFIVHGHDDEAKIKVARFIEKLGFQPIILHEQASSGKTIIEKIEEYSDVGFGIVLYTPCDIGGKNETQPNLKNRARQNVIFEHGYLIGRIGRGNVCALVKGDVETPNDISGVVYIKMQTDEGWHLQLAKELRNSGYSVDMNKL